MSANNNETNPAASGVGSSVGLDALTAALRNRADCERALRAQMDECSARGRLARYGQLPGWHDYEESLKAVVRAENAYIEAQYPQASNRVLGNDPEKP